MNTYQGKGVYDAIAIGIVSIFQRQKYSVPQYAVTDVQRELARLETAKTLAKKELAQIHAQALKEVSSDQAEVFEIHKMLIDDTDYNAYLKKFITENSVNAEYAVDSAAKHFSSLFDAMDDEYMKARGADISDISKRLLRCLSCADGDGSGPTEQTCNTPLRTGQTNDLTLRTGQACDLAYPAADRPKYIICADDLFPSETITLDFDEVAAFVTAGGSSTSHTAILARNMGLPAVIGAGNDFLKGLKNGAKIIVDGSTGEIFLDPDEETESALRQKQAQLTLVKAEQKKALLQQLKGQRNLTKDGTEIRILANISTPEDLDAVLEADAEGIGLFRTEFLYLKNQDYPTEEEQFQAYRSVLERMPDKKVIIRTLDVGADKKVDYFHLDPEENPALGLRAIRLCLARPKLFKTQLRALYRASAHGRLGILFPMITDVSEVEKILSICDEVKKELRDSRIPFDENTELGLMIETPAAALISDLLAPMVDFFSIGTNDLTQYTLAADRQNANVSPFLDPHHKAVLRLIETSVHNAHAHGKWIGICGELASDTALTETFLRLKVDELSVAAPFVLPLRDIVRNLDLRQ